MLAACKSKQSAREVRYARTLKKRAALTTAGYSQALAIVRQMTKWRRQHSRQGPSERGSKLPSKMLARFKLLTRRHRTIARRQTSLTRQISRLTASSWSVLIHFNGGPNIDEKLTRKTAQSTTLNRSLSEEEMSTRLPKVWQSKRRSLERKACQN